MRLLVLALLVPLAARAQPEHPVTASADSLTDAERQVRTLIAEDGIHVVHFWAPWCANSNAELADGWYEVIEREAGSGVSFTFVTTWNDGASARAVLDRYAIPTSVRELALPDFGPSEDEALRRRSFLGFPLTWIPATWIFHQNGQLAYAFNYGELDSAALQQAIDDTRRNWVRE